MTSYMPADAAHHIATDLIRKYHPDLDDVRIDYLFRDPPAKPGGAITWGKARLITGLAAYLSQANAEDGNFFVIEIAEQVWRTLDQDQRIALVDHELSHLEVDEDEDGERILKLRTHTLEEFADVIRRHGLWRDSVEEMADAMAIKSANDVS